MKTNLDTLEHSPIDNSVTYTPGQWFLKNGKDDVEVSVKLTGGDLDGYIATIADCGMSYALKFEEMSANARLVSAAPDLLQHAIQLMRDLDKDFPNTANQLQASYALRDAIAKATSC